MFFKEYKNIKIVQGGNSRQASVYNGLKVANCEYVLIHDGARPMITPEIINKTVEAVVEKKAVSVMTKTIDTIKEVDENYQSLKISLSELDAELKEIVKNSEYDTIVVDNDSFSFLEKYGLNIISLDNSNNQVTEKTISEVKLLLNRNKIKYIFSSSEEVNDIVTNLKDNYGATISVLNTMKSIDGGITNSNQSYLTIMKDNIDLIKKELYK